MKIKILLMAVVLAGLLFSMSASAQVSCQCTDPLTTETVCVKAPAGGSLGTDLNTQIALPKFDPSLGCLQSVRVTMESCGYIWAIVDNEAQFPVTWDVTAISGVRVTLPGGLGSQAAQFGTVGGPEPLFTPTDDPTELPLGSPFNPDFVGPDSARIDFGSATNPICSETEEFIFTNEADKQQFIGGGTLPVQVTSEGQAAATGPSSNVGFESFAQMNATVCVEYTYCPLLCINGTKTNECTGDGIPGWLITLKDSNGAVIGSQQTDADGDYSFCGLAPGDYKVSEETRAGWTPLDPISRDVTLDNVDEVVDFTNAPLGCISGHKFNSKTNAGLSGWTINLKNASGTIMTTTTGTGGSYEFCGLAPGSYTVSEVPKSGWTAVGPTSIDVVLEACVNSEDNDFSNQPTNLVCVCPFFIKNELYTASCHGIYEVDASKGILANDPAGSIVLNPELITIDPKYGTITVEEDGSFVYDPTGATALRTGTYVIFNYSANNGQCDSKYLGIAKIQVSCK